jgi:hypothetical protein
MFQFLSYKEHLDRKMMKKSKKNKTKIKNKNDVIQKENPYEDTIKVQKEEEKRI